MRDACSGKNTIMRLPVTRSRLPAPASRFPAPSSRLPERDRRAQRSDRSTRLRDAQRPCLRCRGAGSRIRDDEHLRARGGIDRFSQAAERDDAPVRDLTDGRHKNIEIARELDVLKTIIEHLDRCAELSLRERACKVA